MIVINWKGWLNLRQYPGIFLEGLMKTTKTLMMLGFLTKIPTGHLPNAIQKC
jgi:hypothetical protein